MNTSSIRLHKTQFTLFMFVCRTNIDICRCFIHEPDHQLHNTASDLERTTVAVNTWFILTSSIDKDRMNFSKWHPFFHLKANTSVWCVSELYDSSLSNLIFIFWGKFLLKLENNSKSNKQKLHSHIVWQFLSKTYIFHSLD